MEDGHFYILCKTLYYLGVNKQNIIMLDSKGVISNKREDLTPEKELFLYK